MSISVARALVTQRTANAALVGISFSFVPTVDTLNRFPRSLITVRTPRTPLEEFAVVPFEANEQFSCSAKDQKAVDFETWLKLLKSAIRAQPLYFTREARIHNQRWAGEKLTFDGVTFVADLTWVGVASWEDV